MGDQVLAGDPRYREMFDIEAEAQHHGLLVESDMNEEFEALRQRAPVQKGYISELVGTPNVRDIYSTNRPGYTCFSFEACNRAFRENLTFSSQIYLETKQTAAMGHTILEMVGREHLNHRAALQPMFVKPVAQTWWRTRWIDEIVEGIMRGLEGRDRADLNIDLCAVMPVQTATRGIGMEGEEALTFRKALQDMAHLAPATPEEMAEGARVVEQMLFNVIEKRRADPGDDVISGLLKNEIELPDGTRRVMTDEEIMANCRLILLAGGGTTWRQLGITLVELMRNPDQYEAVKADRSLVESAINESVRWNATDPVFSRLVVEDVELQGVHIPAGSIIDICLGAANRDPTRWEDPTKYNLFRAPQTHLGFAIGPHRCLGMDVAKTEMEVAINALLDRFPNMRLDPDAPAPKLVGGLNGRGMTSVPVRLT